MMPTQQANPNSGGLPMNTALAPKANAFSMSVPLRNPPSIKISHRPLTAFAMCGKTSIWIIKHQSGQYIKKSITHSLYKILMKVM